MTDVFVLLQLPNAGDDLQAIKKGIMELADVVIYNKADLDATAAERACLQMRSALALLHASSPHWQPPVMPTSALHGQGIDKVWQTLQDYRAAMMACGEFAAKRKHQSLDWMWSMIDAGLRHRFREHPAVKSTLPELTHAVSEAAVTPTVAAHRLLNLLNRYF
jgi:LAO/AO transport system kinase